MPKTNVSKLTTGAAATAMLSALFLTAAAPAAPTAAPLRAAPVRARDGAGTNRRRREDTGSV